LTPGVGLGYALPEGWHIKRRRKVMAQGGWMHVPHEGDPRADHRHDTMANIDLDYGAAVAAIAIESVARAAHDERL
jgi:pyrrolidone-carboxylate peptidase